jgi:hypothetical protein
MGIRLSDVCDFLAAELRSRRHAFSKPLAALPISVRLWFTTRLFTGGRIKYSTPVWVSRAAGHITGRREQCAATG